MKFQFGKTNITMHNHDMESIHGETRKPCQLLAGELRSKVNLKSSIGKKLGVKEKLHRKGNGANLAHQEISCFLKKQTGKRAAKRKLIGGRRQHGTLENRSKSKHSTLSIEDEKSSSAQIEFRDVNEMVNSTKEKKTRRRKKKGGGNDKVDLDEASRLRRRVRYLLIKLKQEQNLIDAYSAEGWKGQSREKIRPEKELQRARKQIWKCKLGLRDVIRQLDSLSTVGSIENSVIAPDGSVYHEHIFCAKCKLREAFPDNDIILCDGTCNCAFHQKCLDPPLKTENIPPGDLGWFCKFCECRMDILEAINAHLGTHFSLSSTWQDIFKEEAGYLDGSNALLNAEEEWPSDDSEDADYNPERQVGNQSISAKEIEDIASDDESSSTSLWSSNNEYSSGTEGIAHGSTSGRCGGFDDSTDGEIQYGRRQRQAVDYKKLYDEMFGKDALAHEQVSEDEDWGPNKRKRSGKESDGAGILKSLCGSDDKNPDDNTLDAHKQTSSKQIRRSFFRIPRDAVEKLRQVFQENELPSRSVKQNLSQELGLRPEKVSKWFKNARYLAIKARKQQQYSNHVHGRIQPLSGDTELVSIEENEAVKSKEIAEEAVAHLPVKEKGVIQIKRSKSCCIPSDKEQQGSQAKGNEGDVDLSDDVSLRRLLKVKPRGKRIISGRYSRAAEMEFDRLSRAKHRLEHVKQKLAAALHWRKSKSSTLREQNVIFVPVAEMKEKLRSI